MRRLSTIFLLLFILAGVSNAQSDPGVFAIIGFFDQELVYLNQSTGQVFELGELAPTANNLKIYQDRLYVINGDDWSTETGASIWVSNLDQITEVTQNGGGVNWTIVPLEDGSNPYDLAGFGQYVYVTLQQGNGVIKLDAGNDYQQVASATDLNMPQGIAVSGEIVCVSETGLGAGDQIYFFDTELNSPHPIQVGRNPQTVTVDQSGDFHVICTGDYADITGEAWRIDPVMNEPETSSIALGGTPGIIVAMNDGNGNEKIACGDEYAYIPPYMYAYDSADMTLDDTVPTNLSGGWSLAAGNDGIFIGSAISNTIQYNAFDWSGYQTISSFDGAVASLVYYEMADLSVTDDFQLAPTTFELSPAWPNPFNASATVELTLDRPRNPTVTLYDLLGRQIGLLHSGMLSTGNHLIQVNAQNLSSGTYFIAVQADGQVVTQRITLVR
ncbi:hypothetical protein BMS3Bbin04_01795 [bacterium BMS3Bbin04]|nr:hypothetical protein BMS3Bbin04_01795 [bacterium BMS3Bbin04]